MMPRSSRTDDVGALHHVMVRGIGRSERSQSNADRHHFVERLGRILHETEAQCYAWALMPNHYHLPLRTGPVPISTVMRRLLTGYALWYHRGHRRHGHLFQNRFKSILCQEHRYLLGLVGDLNEPGRYAYSGHSVLMGKMKKPWQDTKGVLGVSIASDSESVTRGGRIADGKGSSLLVI
jgi:REP element-mobilizing transposase RayT